MRIRILFLGMICLLCYSCSLKQQHVLFERNSPIAIDTSLSQANHYINRIKPDDQLQIRNLQSTKYLVDDAGSTNTNAGVASQVFTVEEDGHVKLPVLGSVFVAGLSRVEAQKKIENLYRDSLLKDPIIDLKIINLKVTIFGEAKSNGNFLLNKEKTTLIDILGQAGGLSVNADEKTIKIIRGKNQTVIPVDLSNIKTIADPRLIMQDGDIVYIQQNKRAIRDDKLQNATTLIQPSLLIFNTALIIYSFFK